MGDFYLALLGIESTIGVFLAGGIAAIAQIVAVQVSGAATSLLWRSRLLRAGLVLLSLSTIWTLVAAIGLKSGWDTEFALGWWPLGLLTGVAVMAAVLLLGIAVMSAVRLLDPREALARLLDATDPSAWGRYVVAVAAPIEVTDSDRAAAAERAWVRPCRRLARRACVAICACRKWRRRN